jgi:hypothetical protein
MDPSEDEIMQAMLKLWPDATLDQDSESQYVINTGIYSRQVDLSKLNTGNWNDR